MEHQPHRQPAASSDEASTSHQELINAFAKILRMNGLEVDNLTECLREATRSNHSNSQAQPDGPANRVKPLSQADQTPRSQLQPDRSIWGPIKRPFFKAPEHSIAINTSTHQGAFHGLSTANHHRESTDDTSPSSGRYTTGSTEGCGPLDSSTRRTTMETCDLPPITQYHHPNVNSCASNTNAPLSLFTYSLGQGAPNVGFTHQQGQSQVGAPLEATSAARFNSLHAGAPTGLGINVDEQPQANVGPHGTSRIPPGLPVSLPENNNTSQKAFRPMQAVLDLSSRQVHTSTRSPDAPTTPNSPFSAPSALKFSDRYFGMHTEGNASADHLASAENCALWLRNLPPDISYRELLSSIRGVGRIWCTFINTPDFVSHSTSAAKVVFFAPESAHVFLRHVETAAPCIRGFRIKADHNRIKYARRTCLRNVSRVLIITGEAWFVNEANLKAWFADKFVFQVDEVIELVKAGGRAVVEFRFGSYRCQAQMGKMSLERMRPSGFEKAEFGSDPCEKGDSLVSYRIVTERIQGSGI